MKWIFLLIAAGVYTYSKAKSYVDKLSVGVRSFAFDRAEYGFQFWNVVIRFVNPTPAEFYVNGFNVDFFLKGNKIGNAMKSEKFLIPASGFVDFTATVKTALLTALPDVITNFIQHKTNDLTFVGTVNVWGFNVPVKIQYSL